jgi:hypothetical protein
MGFDPSDVIRACRRSYAFRLASRVIIAHDGSFRGVVSKGGIGHPCLNSQDSAPPTPRELEHIGSIKQ